MGSLAVEVGGELDVGVVDRIITGSYATLVRAKQKLMDRFKVEDDAVKASVLKKNKKMWRAIRGDVKTWVQENSWRWIEERPAWFTEAWPAKVPADFNPLDEDQIKLEETRKRGGGRRPPSSAADALKQISARIHPID